MINKTPEFVKWFDKAKDGVFKKKFNNRIEQIKQGNFGFNKRLDEYLFELKFKGNVGYRVYYLVVDKHVFIIWGGVKDTQSKDIKKANQILDNIRSK